MRTTQTRSTVSDLILAVFLLSIFLLLENQKESKAQNDTTMEELTLPSTPEVELQKVESLLSVTIIAD